MTRKPIKKEIIFWEKLNRLINSMPNSISLIANGRLYCVDSKQFQDVGIHKDIEPIDELKPIWGVNSSSIIEKLEIQGEVFYKTLKLKNKNAKK